MHNPNYINTSTYDAFGRIKTATSPTGVVSEVSRTWAIDAQTKSVFKITNTSAGTPAEHSYFSLTGENVKSSVQGFDGNLITINRTYNKLGQILTESEPNAQTNTTYAYEPLLNRIQNIQSPLGASVSYTYLDNEVHTTTQQGDITSHRIEKYDASGKIIESIDNGGTVTYTYFSHGNPKSITSPGNVSVTMLYDVFGRQTQLNDPSAGITLYEYDALGRLTKQTDAKQKSIEIAYDAIGRIKSKAYSDGASITYQYDPENAKGLLKKTILSPGNTEGFLAHVTDYSYDAFTRLTEISESFDNRTFTHQFQYDQLNRTTRETYPGGFILNHQYNNQGYLRRIRNAAQQNLWENINMTERLQPQESKYGASINVLHSYTNLGILSEKKASKMHNGLDVNIWRQTYNFNAASGNLQSRGSAIFNNVEHFEYDNLHRLKEVLGQNQQQVQEVLYQPDNNGNIAYKSDAGEYFYDSNRPFAIATLQNPEPALSTQQQDISYTAFNQPLEIEENGFKLKYFYGPDEQRRISELYDAQDNLIKKIYYNGNYEVIETNGNTYEVNYLFAPEGLFGIAVKENNNPVQVYYVETDHLGSILGLYNEAGQPVYSQSFDAWGRERNPTDWSYSAGGGSKPAWLIRGYTGHEHLPEQLSPFGGAGGGLINMNGRMYDPILGRMLSPDNFVQAPSSTQSFNRYSYCWNNPLKYTDPSGEIVWAPIIIGAVVGGYLGGVAASGEWNPVSSDFWNDGWEGVIAGAIIGGLAGTGVGMPIAAKKAGAVLTVGQKATVSGIYSGTLNTVMHASSQKEFGFNSLGYFAAGFAGGYMGASFGPTAGIMIGGIANTSAGIATGNVTDEYSLAQHFVAGALSGYAGYSLAGAKATFSASKAPKAFFKYGIQSNLADFAYDKDQKFFEKGFDHHFGTFFMGGLGGLLQSHAMDNAWVRGSDPLEAKGSIIKRGVSSIIGYSLEYAGTSYVKANYQGLYTSGWQTKTGVSSYKSLMNSLMLR